MIKLTTTNSNNNNNSNSNNNENNKNSAVALIIKLMISRCHQPQKKLFSYLETAW